MAQFKSNVRPDQTTQATKSQFHDGSIQIGKSAGALSNIIKKSQFHDGSIQIKDRSALIGILIDTSQFHDGSIQI